jgi:hypothetical protein
VKFGHDKCICMGIGMHLIHTDETFASAHTNAFVM